MSLIIITDYLYTTDPRDYLYTLLGISIKAEEPALRLNYYENKEDLYFRVGKYIVKRGYGIQLLYYIVFNADNRSLPS
jgi:hypothetical protein